MSEREKLPSPPDNGVRDAIRTYTRERTLSAIDFGSVFEQIRQNVSQSIDQNEDFKTKLTATYFFENERKFSIDVFYTNENFYRRVYFIVQSNGEIAGLALLTFDKTDSLDHLDFHGEIYISDEFKNKKIGSNLIKSVRHQLGMISFEAKRKVILNILNYNAFKLISLSRKMSSEDKIISAEEEQLRWHSLFGTKPQLAKNLDWISHKIEVEPLDRVITGNFTIAESGIHCDDLIEPESLTNEEFLNMLINPQSIEN